jgi:hypothetical protein
LAVIFDQQFTTLFPKEIKINEASTKVYNPRRALHEHHCSAMPDSGPLAN